MLDTSRLPQMDYMMRANISTMFSHKARFLHRNTTMVRSQIDKSSLKSPQKLPKRPESLCHIGIQPSYRRLYTRMTELSHRQGTNWQEVSLSVWSLTSFGRSLLEHEGSLHNKVVFYLAMFCYTLWLDKIPCAFYCFTLLFLMSFCDVGSCCVALLSFQYIPLLGKGSRVLFSWRVNGHF